MKFVCYCCSEPLGESFVLLTMQEQTDRVFLMKPEHVKRIYGQEVSAVPVRREKGTRTAK